MESKKTKWMYRYMMTSALGILIAKQLSWNFLKLFSMRTDTTGQCRLHNVTTFELLWTEAAGRKNNFSNLSCFPSSALIKLVWNKIAGEVVVDRQTKEYSRTWFRFCRRSREQRRRTEGCSPTWCCRPVHSQVFSRSLSTYMHTFTYTISVGVERCLLEELTFA